MTACATPSDASDSLSRGRGRRFVATLCLCLAACTEQRAGGPCEQRYTDTAFCENATALLLCTGGKYVRYPCPGPNGCVQTGNAWTCDFRGSADGDTCPSSLVGLGGCGLDGASAFTCTAAGWVSQPCRVCTETATAVRCVPRAGTSCAADAGLTCDGAALLSCEGGTWQSYPCPGALGCLAAVVANSAIAYKGCDFTGTDAGQPCPAAFSDQAGYCASGTELLQCHGGAFRSLACAACTTDAGASTCG